MKAKTCKQCKVISMTKCTQCNESADMHIHWVIDNTQNDAEICNQCMTELWNGSGTDQNGKKLHGFKNTQFGQSLIITPLN